jgi:hypothetical protein
MEITVLELVRGKDEIEPVRKFAVTGDFKMPIDALNAPGLPKINSRDKRMARTGLIASMERRLVMVKRHTAQSRMPYERDAT